MPFGVIQSAEYADHLLQAGEPEKFDKEPIGTGPFAFAAYLADVAVRYRAFDDYWAGRQPIDTLVFSITSSASVRLIKLKSGECHVAAYPAPADREEIAADSKLKLWDRPGFNISYLALTTTHPPLNDVRVRRAVNMAIDKAAIIEAILGGAGVVAKNPIPRLFGRLIRTSSSTLMIPRRPGRFYGTRVWQRASTLNFGMRRQASPTIRTPSVSPR